MFRKLAYAAVACAAMLGLSGQPLCPAHAETQAGEDAPAPHMLAAPGEQGNIMHVTLVVEGEDIAARQTIDENGRTLIDARPIIEALNGQISHEGTRLIIRRYQDGARMSIDFADGKVRAGKSVLGKLPEWTPSETPHTWLEANAIAVLTGCHVIEGKDGRLVLTLDDRLRPQFDLDLFVEGERLGFLNDPPRTVGSILLIPLRPVAQALGHEVTEDTVAGTVSVTRIQDSARFTLDFATGLVSINGEPRGVTPNISYGERGRLLLPFSAVETLTGTHIVLEPGSDRIDVRLDERLATGALPGARVADDAADTPLTLEKLDFSASNRGSNTAALHARLGGFTSVTRYETAGGFGSPEELQPRWLSMDIESLSGWQASFGDATPRLGELSGVGVSRIRGASWRKRTSSDTIIAIAAGVPVSGSTAISERASRPTFAGQAIGARLINPGKDREIALAYASGQGGRSGRLVASAKQEIITEAGEEGRAGLAGAFASADLGLFGSGIDIRGQIDAHYRLSRSSGLRASFSHEGAAFSPVTGPDEPAATAPQDDTVTDGGPPALASERTASETSQAGEGRTRAHMSVDWRARDAWGFLHHAAGGARVSATRNGQTQTRAASVSASARLGANGADVAFDLGRSSSKANGEETALTQLRVRGLRRFDWGRLEANYSLTQSDDQDRQQLVATVIGRSIHRPLGKQASMTLAPSATGIADAAGQSLRFGGVASFQSGQALGERLSLNAQLSALQSVDPDKARTDFFASMQARYRVHRSVELEAAYFDNFSNSRSLSLGLRGSLQFNPPRKHNLPLEGRGVLKGQVFFDRNRDGVRQEDEPGIPGVRVAIRNTRLGLQVDPNGYYTIQNMKTGLFSLRIDRRSLPLGMLVRDDTALRATIGDGRITQLDIPVIASGQIRGTVFVDTNGDARPGPGERRLEGAWLSLTALDDPHADTVEQVAASFGQFAFDGLSPGRYRLTVNHGAIAQESLLELTEDELFLVHLVPVTGAPGEPPPPDPDGAVEFTA